MSRTCGYRQQNKARGLRLLWNSGRICCPGAWFIRALGGAGIQGMPGSLWQVPRGRGAAEQFFFEAGSPPPPHGESQTHVLLHASFRSSCTLVLPGVGCVERGGRAFAHCKRWEHAFGGVWGVHFASVYFNFHRSRLWPIHRPVHWCRRCRYVVWCLPCTPATVLKEEAQPPRPLP